MSTPSQTPVPTASPAVASPITPVPRPTMLILIGLLYGLAGILMARFLVIGFLGALGVALTAVGIIETMRSLFSRHRDISWSPGGDPQAASTELVMNLLHLLGGVVLAYVIFAIRLSSAELASAFSFQMKSVFLHRDVGGVLFADHFSYAIRHVLVIAGVTFLMSAIYKESGLSLTLAWVGSLWGISIVEVIRQSGGVIDPLGIGLTGAALAAQSVGLVTSGTVGLFLARGAQKYPLRSAGYSSIVRTCLLLFGGAVGFLFFSAALHALVGRTFNTPVTPF